MSRSYIVFHLTFFFAGQQLRKYSTERKRKWREKRVGVCHVEKKVTNHPHAGIHFILNVCMQSIVTQGMITLKLIAKFRCFQPLLLNKGFLLSLSFLYSKLWRGSIYHHLAVSTSETAGEEWRQLMVISTFLGRMWWWRLLQFSLDADRCRVTNKVDD